MTHIVRLPGVTGVVVAALLSLCPGAACERPASKAVSSGEPTHPQPDEEPAPTLSDDEQHGGAARSPIGTNLGRLGYPTGVNPFTDLMKATDPWFSGAPSHPNPSKRWADGAPLHTDRTGWVKKLRHGQVARAFVLGEGVPQPSGKVTVLYKGEGTINYQGRVSQLRRSPGKDEFRLDGKNGLYLDLVRVNPQNHLRDVRIYIDSLGGPEDGIFTRGFLDTTRDFAVLRAMDWTTTNREAGLEDGKGEPMPFVHWEDYPQRSSLNWRTVPFDVVAELGNTVGADIWVNVPHTATDDFVLQMAKSVHDTLDPEHKVYVEYSNETWNSMFDQAYYVGKKGCAKFAKDPKGECTIEGTQGLCSASNRGTNGACYIYGLKYHAFRAAQIMVIWERVFKDRPGKLVRVLGGRVGGMRDGGGMMLELLWNGEEPVHEHIDIYATAPYFGGDLDQSVEYFFEIAPKGTNGVPEAMPYALSGRPSGYGGLYSWVQSDANELKKYPAVSLATYEGGQHLTGYTPETRKRMFAINNDPRIKTLYLQYLDMWAKLTGGALFVHYTGPEVWSNFGAWGSKQYPAQPREEAPKHDALLTYIEQTQQQSRLKE